MPSPTRFPKIITKSDGQSSEVTTSVNGVSLNTLAYNFTTRSGMHTASGLRGSNPVTASRDGSIFRPGKRREENVLQWKMWASPVAENGTIPTSAATAYANWRANMDKLLALFDSSAAPIRVVQNNRECWAEVRESIDPEMATGNVGAFEVTLVMYESFWRDTADLTFNSPSGTGAVALHNVAPLAGATAPMADLVYVVHGPIGSPRITDEKTGHYVELTSLGLLDTQTWTLNAALATSVISGGAGNKADWTTSVGVWSPALMVLSPQVVAATPPQLRLSGSGADVGTQLTVTGRRKYR